jgi:hypothetical protein
MSGIGIPSCPRVSVGLCLARVFFFMILGGGSALLLRSSTWLDSMARAMGSEGSSMSQQQQRASWCLRIVCKR